MNYWHDDDHDIWYDSLSSEEPTVDINDHLDTKNFNMKPTKDINDQADTKESPEYAKHNLQWIRIDPNVKVFYTTKKGGPN